MKFSDLPNIPASLKMEVKWVANRHKDEEMPVISDRFYIGPVMGTKFYSSKEIEADGYVGVYSVQNA